MFQKVNDWLADRSERFARGGNANTASGGAYYASSEAEQAYGGAAQPAQDDRLAADPDDPYGGRVPYRSQRDLQAEAEMQRQQMEEQARRQQAAAQQRQMQQFGRAPQAQAAVPQQQGGNVLQFPGMIRGPEGNLYAHVEYVVLLRNRNECTKVIEYIKSNASVFLNMEFIANDSERQRCVDMLSGAAYTLGCRLNKISQRGIYLISSPSVYVVVDPAMQKYTAAEAQGYRRADYGAYAAYGAGAPGYGYAQQPGMGYGAAPQAPQYAAQPGAGYAAAPQYGAQPYAGYGAPQQAGYAASQGMGYGLGAQTAGFSTQPAAGFTADANTGAYRAQTAEAQPRRTAAYDAQGAYWKGFETAAAN